MPTIEYMASNTPSPYVFPAVGNLYEVDYGGDLLVRLEFHSISSLTIYGMKGKYKDFVETVKIEVTPLRQDVFMVAWQEENQTTVVHVEDFGKGVIYANITKPGNEFMRIEGPFRRVE
ncbi:MoaF-related domain-containing protein [Pleomorphomonas carboxyditropha]|uniref:MoaF-like domain-containing protein n=1 Tax=Pleomorphomonas carboxyditropha TaxID=2023338 RepID=A0A2G9WSE5_9HYPH|nr:hypothetical protein [Pleomorphomonas carboxyditropha]PIO97638.1 hypothetical protein CJ014_19440 [Pleomorphomonas carboxyditropha]